MNTDDNNPSQTNLRSAFTLIELLLVISVIAVLASLSVNVIASAQQDARVASTRARIALIESVMEVELEDYEVRRSPISFRAIGDLTASVPNSVWANSGRNAATGVVENNFLLHAKNLKRMIVADLIRSEFPSGRDGQPAGLGVFPSGLFRNYLRGLNISDNDIDQAFRRSQPANVSRWAGWVGFAAPPADFNNLTANEISQLRADSAEVLYAVFSQLEFEGTSALDALGSSAVGNTDGDSFPEIIDAFGDPIAFEFHQRNIAPVPSTSSSGGDTGVWSTPVADPSTGELERPMINFEFVNPVLPSDIRFFATSETLAEIDGDPVDLQ